MMKTQYQIKTSSLLLLLLLALSSAVVADEFSPKAVEAPLLEYPFDGEIVSTPSPRFQWNIITVSDTYKLVVKDASGAKVWKKKYNGAAICASYICKADPLDDGDWSLPNGKGYTWKVVAIESEGKASSLKSTFDVNAPGAVNLISPDNDHSFYTPSSITLTWEENLRATEYRVVLKHISGGSYKVKSAWLSSETVCETFCSYTITDNFPHGEYRWKVIARQSPFKNKSNSKRQFKIYGII